jgi:hypothetical protein
MHDAMHKTTPRRVSGRWRGPAALLALVAAALLAGTGPAARGGATAAETAPPAEGEEKGGDLAPMLYRVRPGTVPVEVKILPPEKCKVNELAPSAFTLTARKGPEGKPIELENAKSEKSPKALEAKTEIPLAAGATLRIEVKGELYPCSVDGQACYPPIPVDEVLLLAAETGGEGGTVAFSKTLVLPGE